jgi:hypothetical protein
MLIAYIHWFENIIYFLLADYNYYQLITIF